MAGAVAGKHALSEPCTVTTTTSQGARLVMWSLGSGGLEQWANIGRKVTQQPRFKG
jgi:hypothetical protein